MPSVNRAKCAFESRPSFIEKIQEDEDIVSQCEGYFQRCSFSVKRISPSNAKLVSNACILSRTLQNRKNGRAIQHHGYFVLVSRKEGSPSMNATLECYYTLNRIPLGRCSKLQIIGLILPTQSENAHHAFFISW